MATSNMQPTQAMQLLAPDIAQEQNQLSRRQQMADMLRKQSLESSGNTEVINGWAVKKSPLEGLSKMAQALSANYIQDSTDTRQLELAKALQGRMGDILGGGGQAAPQMENRTDDAAMGPQAGIPAPQAPGTPAAPTNNFTMANLLRGQVIGDLGGQGAGTAFWDGMKATDAAKRDRELGISAPESRASELAKRLKEGTQSLIPNQTNIAPDGTRIVAPDFANGSFGGFDKQGQPTSNEIPGAATIAANRAGLIKGAEAGITDRFAVPTKVDAVTGPVAMTNSQQRAAANGGVDPAVPAPSMFQQPKTVAPINKNPMASRSGDSDQVMIFQGEMKSAQDRLLSAKTPEEKIRAQSDVENVGREMSRLGIKTNTAQPSSAGIPLKSDTQKELDSASVKLQTQPGIDRNIQTAKDMAEYEKNLNGHVSESQALLQRIAQSRDALTRFSAGGGGEMRGKIASFAQAIPGMPNSVIDKIAGGDLSALQEFQKYAAQEALGTMQQALASDTGKGAQGNRVAMQLFIKNNPNVDTDPRAIEKIFNFQTKLHNNLLDQSNAYQGYKKDGKDLSEFPNHWANEEIKRGSVTPEIKTGYAKGNVQTSVPANVQSLLNKYK